MTDRELLLRAAKAAGIPIMWDDEADVHLRTDRLGCVPWNPLTDDGDAFRLAVKLQIGIRHRASSVDASFKQSTPAHHEDYGSDPYAATRRAIVRAAASLAEAGGSK